MADDEAGTKRRRGMRELLLIPHYAPLLIAGLLFDFAMIGMAFLG